MSVQKAITKRRKLPVTTLLHTDSPSTVATSTEQAFDEVFQTYWTRIYQLCFRLVGDPVEAEDLALETFVRLHKKPRLLQPDQNVGGWLYRVATNLGYNALRAAQRRAKYETASVHEFVPPTQGDDPADLAEIAVERAQVRHVLAQMKPRAAKLLLLRHSGLPYDELAKVLRLNPKSVGKMLSRAERDFEKRYLAQFGDPS